MAGRGGRGALNAGPGGAQVGGGRGVRAAAPAAPRAGRGRNFTKAQVIFALECIARHLPAGADEWDFVARDYNEHFGAILARNAEDLRNKFKKLRNTHRYDHPILFTVHY